MREELPALRFIFPFDEAGVDELKHDVPGAGLKGLPYSRQASFVWSIDGLTAW